MATCNLPFDALKYTCGPIAQPMPGAVRSPFVNMIFFQGQRQVTVGNKSSNSASVQGLEDIANIGTAFIKSFTYSFSNGLGCEALIVDTSGSDFANFLSVIPGKECNQFQQDYGSVAVEFGWIFQDCNGVYQKYGTVEASYDESLIDATDGKVFTAAGDYLWFLLESIEVKEAKGIWEYKLICKSTTQASAPYTKDANPIGSDDNKVPLKQACTEVLKESCKNYFNNASLPKLVGDAVVKFVRISKNFVTSAGGTSTQKVLTNFQFKGSDGGPDGPKSVWAPEQQDPLSAIRKWLNSFETDRNLGTYIVSDVKTKSPTLYIMENPNDPCLFSKDCAANQDKPKKVYIVNGGQCSPVINFSPSIQLVFHEPTTNISANPTGTQSTNGQPETSTGPNANSSTNTNKCYKGDLNRKGLETAMSIPGSNLNFRAPSQANQKEFKSIWANSQASKMFEITNPIEADLEIEGDPRYIDTISTQATRIGVIYLNPYAIRNNLGDCDWIAYPNVNEFFSRTSYLIKGVSHSITEQGFRTTLKLSTAIENTRE